MFSCCLVVLKREKIVDLKKCQNLSFSSKTPLQHHSCNLTNKDHFSNSQKIQPLSIPCRYGGAFVGCHANCDGASRLLQMLLKEKGSA